MRKVIWMFAGQGAQYYQMGRELYEREPLFREYLERGDRLALDLVNISLVDLIYRPRADRFEPFRRLLYTHPAVFLFECALAELLKRRGLHPDYLLGYSLGEYASLVVAGSLSFEETFVSLIKQAELVEYCAPSGGMLAILDSADLIDRYPEIFRDCTVAAYNFSRNFVASGSKSALERVKRFLPGKGINSVDLPVDYPFHSPLIDGVRTILETIFAQLSIAPPNISIITAEKGETLKNPAPGHLWDVIRNPVNLSETIRQLEKSGPYFYVDLGPSGSMATAIKYNLGKESQSGYFTIASPFGNEARNLNNLLEKFTGSMA
jgi:bacillaene synthase trans-acting acyltransferase